MVFGVSVVGCHFPNPGTPTQPVAAGYMAIFYPMMRNEVKLLKQTFPDFAQYEQRVPLFFPKLSLWNSRRKFEINFDRVKRTLIDSSLALLAIPAIILFHWIS